MSRSLHEVFVGLHEPSALTLGVMTTMTVTRARVLAWWGQGFDYREIRKEVREADGVDLNTRQVEDEIEHAVNDLGRSARAVRVRLAVTIGELGGADPWERSHRFVQLATARES